MNLWIQGFLLLPAAFLIGSIPWGFLFTRAFSAVDIRQTGSGNIGATNVKRATGWTLGILTLLGDVAKGALPVFWAGNLTAASGSWGEAYLALVALLAVLGHLYPAYTRFQGGGKGVATAAGAFLILSPIALFILILIFTMMVCYFNRISLASLSAALAAPVVFWEATGSIVLSGYAAIMALLILLRHQQNIRRLLQGTEPSFFRRDMKSVIAPSEPKSRLKCPP